MLSISTGKWLSPKLSLNALPNNNKTHSRLLPNNDKTQQCTRNGGILLIGPWGTNFSEILIGIQIFSFKKMHLKMSSAKWRPFCIGLNVLCSACEPLRAEESSGYNGATGMSVGILSGRCPDTHWDDLVDLTGPCFRVRSPGIPAGDMWGRLDTFGME